MRAQSRVVNADSTLSDRIKPGFALRNINAQTFEAVSFTVTDARQIQSVIRFPPENHPHGRTVPALPDLSGGAILPKGATVPDENPTIPLDRAGGASCGPGEGDGVDCTHAQRRRGRRHESASASDGADSGTFAKLREPHSGSRSRVVGRALDERLHVRLGQLTEAPGRTEAESLLTARIAPRQMLVSGG